MSVIRDWEMRRLRRKQVVDEELKEIVECVKV